MKRLIALCAAAALYLCAPMASAVVVTFDGVPSPGGNGLVFGLLSTDGFDFSSPHGHLLDDPFGCSTTCADNGTKYLGGDMSDLFMSMTGGGTFSLFGFDMAEAFAGLTIPTTLRLVGHHSDSSTSFLSIPFDAIFDGAGSLVDFQFVFVGWTDLVSVEFHGDGWFGIDNVRTDGEIPVPAPAGLSLLALGLLGLRRLHRA